MIGNDFFYDGHWLSEFGMMVFDPDETQRFVGRTIDKANITALRPVPNHYSTSYVDVLKLSFLIVREEEDEYLQQDEKKLSGEDINVIMAWLESPKLPTKLIAPTEDDIVTTNYFGVFTDIQPYTVGNECYGLFLTFSCNAPYGFSDVNTKKYVLQSGVERNIIFMNNSAEHYEYIKPTVIIKSSSTFGNNNTIRITNVTDGNKYMFLKMPVGISKIIIDCQKKSIQDNNGNIITLSDLGITLPTSNNYNFVSAELYVFYWLRLLPNKNNIKFLTSEGSTISEVEIQSRNVLKSGGF